MTGMSGAISPTSRWGLAALALVMLLPSLGTSIANVALPILGMSFAASDQEVQWVVIAYLLAITSLIVVAGRLGDLLGRRRLLLAGIAIFTVASTVGALAPNLWVLVAARGIQGVGAALMMSLAVAMVSDLIPKDRAGTAMGLMGTVSAVGTAMGPSLGGGLIALSGWPAVFVTMALAGIVTLMVVSLALPGDRQGTNEGSSLDVAGAVLLAVSLGAFALSATVETGLPGRAALVVGSVLGLVAFVAVERSTVSPLIQFRMLRDAHVSTGLVSLALVSAILMATLVVGPFYLSGVLGLDPLMTGLVMTVGPGVAALTGVPAGRLVDRLGSRAVISTGLGGVALASAMMTVLPAAFGVTGYVVSLAVITMSYALFQAANTTAVMSTATADRRGVTSALLALARNLGLVTGASAMGALFGLGSRAAEALGRTSSGEAGLRLTFTVATVLGGAALAAACWESRRTVPAGLGQDPPSGSSHTGSLSASLGPEPNLTSGR